VKKYGKRKASKLKSTGLVLVQLQDERAEQVRCRLTSDEAREMVVKLRRFAHDVEVHQETIGMTQGGEKGGSGNEIVAKQVGDGQTRFITSIGAFADRRTN
jgi:hypothetical protein